MKRIVHVQFRVRVAVLCAAIVAGSVLAVGPVALAGGRHIDINAFMTGLACVESGGRYDARNSYSGAYGKYQIMPRIWPAWAARYVGDRWAQPTPRNQEFVARMRVLDLFELHQAWRLVAHWWLTGNANPDETTWSAGSMRYVDRVMAFARASLETDAQPAVPRACFPADFREPEIRTQPWPRVITIGRVHLRVAAGFENRATGTLRRGVVVAVLQTASDVRGKPWILAGLPTGTIAWMAAWYTRPME
jgi:hypothetical protein